MKTILRCFIVASVSVLLWPFCGFSEGTKQIMPTNTGVEKLMASTPSSTLVGFAYYNCPADLRLNIHIRQAGEKIYFGMRKYSGSNVTFRIKDPAENIVYSGLVPTSGTGYIPAWSQAVAGPLQIVGTEGYDALLYTPATNGDFIIEFSTTVTLLYFDVTVADASNNPINGRLWSKAWQFDTGNTYPNDSHQTLYVYTVDGFVTSVNMNSLQGITYTVACNQWGCPDPSRTIYTRASVNGMHALPQYKIFINDPDTSEYPTGVQGQLSNKMITRNCDGSAEISFDMTKAGTVDLLLDIDPAPGKQPTDVLLTTQAVAGHNSVHWNGLNGSSVEVPNGMTFNIEVSYLMGLVNLPMYDIEQNANGLKVAQVRPSSGQPLLVYWDDTGLAISPYSNCGTNIPAPPGSNLAGCNTATSSCHTWLSAGSGNPGQCSYGNENTVNEYWYTSCTSDTLFQFTEHRISGHVTAKTDVSCYGQSTGIVTVEGIGYGPFTYALETGTYGSGNTFNGLSAGSYTVHIQNSDGCIFDQPVSITQPATPRKLMLSGIYPEGLYAGSGMLFKARNGAVDAYQADTADMITVELHNQSSYSTIVYSASAALKTNGTVSVVLPCDITSPCFVTIRHRNHLETTTAQPVDLSGYTVSFTLDAAGKAFGANMTSKLEADGETTSPPLIYGGDINQDGQMEAEDINEVGNLAAVFAFGFLPEDVYCDGQIEAEDINILGNNAAEFVYVRLPM